MLANLVENAIRHSSPGAYIDVALCASDSKEGPQVTISDDGPGIPEAERDKVFRRFYRLDASRSTPGNGLGLALVAAVSDLHGAKIQLFDNPPRGLRVVLTFAETMVASATAEEVHGGAYCAGIGGPYSRVDCRRCGSHPRRRLVTAYPTKTS